MNKVKVWKAGEHQISCKISDASCFYFSDLSLSELAKSLEGEGGLVALPGRIEVSDKIGPLHFHHGATIAFITSGYGVVNTEQETMEVSAGDILIVPPRVKHLSIAAPNTTMVEHVVFLGKHGDLQAVYD